MGLGMKGLMADLGLEVEVRVNADSSAAKSIASRRGAGMVRRIEVRAGGVGAGPCREGRTGDQESEGRGELRWRIDQPRGAYKDGLLHEGARVRAEER